MLRDVKGARRGRCPGYISGGPTWCHGCHHLSCHPHPASGPHASHQLASCHPSTLPPTPLATQMLFIFYPATHSSLVSSATHHPDAHTRYHHPRPCHVQLRPHPLPLPLPTPPPLSYQVTFTFTTVYHSLPNYSSSIHILSQFPHTFPSSNTTLTHLCNSWLCPSVMTVTGSRLSLLPSTPK